MSNNSPKKIKPVLLIIAVVALSLVLFFAMRVFNITEYRWALELAVIVAAVCAVYGILRGKSEYACDMIGENLVFKQKMGKGERYVFALDTKHVRLLMTEAESDAEISRRGIKAVPKYYSEATEADIWGILYYDEVENCEKILKFKPSQQILAVLLRKSIDNGAKM